jgi:predicted O-methyltransferase YrrM
VSFTEEWFCVESQQALAALAESTNHLDGDVVEVGCWQGRSTVALAGAVRPAVVHAVDTWQGSPNEISADLAGERDVLHEFLENMAELTDGNVVPHVMGWREYFADHRHPVRFIHIDAEHSYREVFDNIAEVLPLMVSGGVICGDDVHHPPVQQAVFEQLGSVAVTATLWHWRVP